MSRSRTMRRYAVPAAIAAGAITVAGGITFAMASADDLPDKSAEELLADVQGSDVKGLSGTVEENADLGLPEVGKDDSSLASLSSGSHTLGVWYSSHDKGRVALQNDVSETDVVRDGGDVYTWNSDSGDTRHSQLSDKLADMPFWSPSMWTSAPSDTAKKVASLPNTELETDGTQVVAGRDTYGLVMSPNSKDSLVDHVRLSVDAETGVPLSTQVYSLDDPKSPALDITFSDVTFGQPDSKNFKANVDGKSVKESSVPESAPGGSSGNHRLGHDWSSVGVSEMTQDELVDALVEQGADSAAVENYLEELPQVENGKMLESSLFSAYLTDDGRIFYGSVDPETLVDAAQQ